MSKQFTIKPFLAIIIILFLFEYPAFSDEECDCFPHSSDWANVEEHGLYVFNNGTNPYCTECHDTDLTGGYTGVSCYSCHPSYPHSSGWSEASIHGDYAMDHGYETNCKNACHGEDYNGGYAEVSCYDCHELFPHTTYWANSSYASRSDYHGQYVMAQSAIDSRVCSTLCHDEDYGGGLSNVSCFDCHEAYPHSFNWSRPDTHGLVALSYGVSNSCGGTVKCHGSNYDGGYTEIGCTDCHENFPHPSNYDDDHQSMSETEAYQCATLCHGADLTGGISGVDCTTCHDNIAWPLFKLIVPPFELFFLP